MTDLQPYLDQLAVTPADEAALDTVEEVYTSQGRWEELVRVYEDNALRAAPNISINLFRKAAKICLEEISSVQRAEMYLKRAIELNAADIDSLRMLREIYLAYGKHESALEIFEKELANTADPHEKAVGLVEAAIIYRDRLERLDKALSTLRQAERSDNNYAEIYRVSATIYQAQGRLEQTQESLLKELAITGPTSDLLDRLITVAELLLDRPKLHRHARVAIEIVLGERGDDDRAKQVQTELDAFRSNWSRRVDEISQRAKQLESSDKESAASAWVSVAEIQLIYGKQEDAALASLDRSLACVPGHQVALRLLEEIYGTANRYDELSLKLEMMAAYTREPQIAIDLYLKAALHHAVRLDNADAAARIYSRVLQLDPGNKVAANAIAEYFRERKLWKEALQVLSQWAERATQAADKVAAHYACCRILEEELDKREQARPHYEAILNLDPQNQAAAIALEGVYRQAKDYPALARTLKAKLSGINQDDRLATLAELGDLFAGPLNNPTQAIETLGELYRYKPDAKLRERLEEMAARNNLLASLVQILESGYEKIETTEDKIQALHSLAAIYEGAHAAPLQALRVHRRILALDNNDARATLAVERLLEAAAASGDRVALYEEQARAANTDTERVKLLQRLATELIDNVHDHMRAADVYRQILKISPSDITAIDGLLLLYRRDNRVAEVAEMLSHKIKHLPADTERVPLVLELAGLYEKQKQVDLALERYLDVIDAQPGHKEALAASERLLNHSSQVLSAAKRLAPHFQAAGRFDLVAQMLEIQIQKATDPTECGVLLADLANTYEAKLKRPADAFLALLRSFQANPANNEVQSQLERLSVSLGDIKALVRAYRAATSVLEGEQRIHVLLRAGSLSAREGDTVGATVDFLRALGAAEGSSDLAAKSACDGLTSLFKTGLPVSKIREASEQVAEALPAAARSQFWRTLARLFDKTMNSYADAIIAWKNLLATHQNDPEAMAELDRLYESSPDPLALAEHLRTKIDAAVDDTSRAALVGQLAEVLGEKLGDTHSAIAELNRVAELAPGQRLVWQRLAAMYQKAGMPKEAAQAIHREINLLPDGPERRTRVISFSELSAKELGDIASAISAIQSVVTQEPAHQAAIQLLAEIYPAVATDPVLADQTVAMLITGYREASRWQELITLQASRLDTFAKPEERVDALIEMATIKAEKLNDIAGAVTDLERAFTDAPLNPELRSKYEKLIDKTNAYDRLVTTYTAALGVVADPESQRPIRRKLAQVLDKVGRGEEAIEHYRAAGGGSLPDDLPSLEALERILRTQERPLDLADVLSAITQKLPPDQRDRKKAIYLELGQLYDQVLSDKSHAADMYRALNEVDPRDLRGLRALEGVLGSMGQHEERAQILDKLIEVGAASPEIVDDYLKRAQVAIELDQPTEAFKNYRAVLLKKREHPAAIAGLEALIEHAENKTEIAQVLEPIYIAKQDHGKLAWVLEQRVDGIDDLSQRKGLLRRIGDIYENRLSQKNYAFAMARRSLSLDPGDMGVRMWIEKLAGEINEMRPLADAYIEEAQKADAKLALQFHRRAAAILHEKLNDTAGAVGEYQAILNIESRDEKALAGLESIFRATEAWSELVEILQRRLLLCAGLERKREFLAEIASIQTQKLQDASAAVETYKAVLSITPDDTYAFEQIERLLAQLLNWADLDDFYKGEIQRLSDKRSKEWRERRLELMYRRGRIADEQFDNREDAITIFGEVLNESSEHASTVQYLQARAGQGVMEALALLEKVYKSRGAWPRYVEILQARLQQTAETEQRQEIYLELSLTFDERLKTGDMAFRAIAYAFNENRADFSLLEKLEAIAEKYGYWQEIIATLSRDLDTVADPKLRQHLLHRLGAISGERLNDPARAIAYLQQALQYEPSDETALSHLDSLLEKNQMWAALADILERRIDMADEPKQKSQFLERLAWVWGDKLMDAEAALRCHKQILEIDPDHPLTLKSMQRLYAEVQDWDSLAKNLARQAEVLKDKEEQLRIHVAAGQLFAEELSDNHSAIEHWLKVVEIEINHQAANQALDVLLASEDMWDELAEHYRRQLTFVKDPTKKSEIHRRLGVILGEKLGRSEDALKSWREVLSHDTKNIDALRALSGLYRERAMWEEFVDVARRLIPLVDPAEAKEVRLNLASALGEHLDRREEAIRLAREVRATEPHTVEQLDRLAKMLIVIEAFDEAVIVFEKAGALETENDAKIGRYLEAATIKRDQLKKPNDARIDYEAILEVQPSHFDAFTALAEIYRVTNDWRKLVVLNESFVPHAAPDLRLLLITEIRDVQEQKLGERELAFISGCRVYKENPLDLEAAQILERIGIETGGAEELVAVLEDEIDNIIDTDVKIASLRRIARIYAEHLQDVPLAEETLNKILIIQPNDLEALDTLAQLGATQERYDKQIQALEQKLLVVSEDVQRKSILTEIARVWEDRINEIDEAISALSRALEIDGSDIAVLDELARIFAKENRWGELAHTLTRKVELSVDPAESVDLRMRVGSLCESELGDPETAIQWYRGVLDFDGAHQGALAALDRLYTGLERWSELIGVFEVQLQAVQDTEEKIRLLSKTASIYENQFDSSRDAGQCFERVLQIDATHIPSIKSLERLLRTLGEFNRLIEIVEHHIKLLSDQNEITELYLEMGEIYYRDLARVDKAEQIYNVAREINPQSTAALHALGQLYERSGNWFQSLEMLQAEADILGGEPEALPVLTRIGRINEEMLMDNAAAKAVYERALAIDQTYAPALSALKEIAKNIEDWDSYANYLITEAETAGDTETKTELFVEAAHFFNDIRNDEQNSVHYFQRALETTPGHIDAAKALAEIYFRSENWQEAGELYSMVVQSLDKSQDAKDYCQKSHRLGYISERLGDSDIALTYYRQAYEADPTYLPALEGLGHSLLVKEQWEEAQKVFQSIINYHRDSLTESEVVDVQWQIGDICLKQNQPDRAYKQFERALEIDPDHGPSLFALAKLDKEIQNWESACERLSRLADVAPAPERVVVLMELGDIASQHLMDTSRAIEALERARRLNQPRVELYERLAEIYLATQQAQKAAEALEQGLGVVNDSNKQSEINFRLGFIYETELRHEPMAVQKYNAALDAQATNIKAFEAIERILSMRQEWALLEANYRAMISRAKELSVQVRLVLWHNLGELYHRVLKNVDGAIMAYEVLQKLNPGKKEDLAILAELYAQKPESRSKAINMQHEVLPTIENPVGPIRNLRKLYHAERDFDAVYCLSHALVFLKEADEEERKVHDYLAQGVPPKAARGLIEDQWKSLLHPETQNPVGILASWIYRSAAQFVTVPAKDLGLRKKDQIDVRQSDLYFANLARYAAKVLGVPVFDVFKRPVSNEPLHLENSQPPALVAGENNDVFRDAVQRVVLFHIGRNLAFARPELFLAGIFLPDQLREVLLGMCLIYNRSLPHNSDPREVGRWAQLFERMPAPILKRMQPVAQAAYPEIVKGVPLETYLDASEYTATRAGFIVAGDLYAAARGIGEGASRAATLSTRDRIKELLLFSVSRPYLELRKVIGAALVENKAAAAK
ncbi:MAG: hypothetical protein JW841_04650 [Deltaproteobacteria bacterium]|nr:hypothetical protein [Deltaproteobacteria bacterium]